ncbi:hypothetical protein TheetDRAFT_1558 [Thermoanaerobacter ethanolicus JW 200]|uniref:hypothetical protein n=1 Tax=Thermoanaerobacter ethanolicus TaxID=1757 RepID=UPI000202E616|nr:hypothetical protein TheetDRAFT_1558 [Thermoanaerobacter ethanolicus JW 200]
MTDSTVRSKLLFEENPIVVDKTLAKVIGLNEAIVLQQVHYWLVYNSRNQINFIDGRYWTYNSIKEWHEQYFDFWSYDTVKRTFQKLEKMGLLISAKFNDDKLDQTKWYTIDYEKLNLLYDEYEKRSTAQCIGANCTNGMVQNDPMHECSLPQCTYNNKYKHTNIKQTNINNNNPQSGTNSQPSAGVVVEINELYKKVAGRDKLSFFAALLKVYPAEKIMNAVAYLEKAMLRGKIDNPEGFLISALKENWDTQPFERKSQKEFHVPKNYFNSYTQRTYDVEELERKLLEHSRKEFFSKFDDSS